MNWNGKKVLVTGAGGFIASHLVERLVSEGAQGRAFVRYNLPNDIGMLKLIPVDVFSQLEVKHGDLRDVEAVRNAVKSVDTVFHLDIDRHDDYERAIENFAAHSDDLIKE